MRGTPSGSKQRTERAYLAVREDEGSQHCRADDLSAQGVCTSLHAAIIADDDHRLSWFQLFDPIEDLVVGLNELRTEDELNSGAAHAIRRTPA